MNTRQAEPTPQGRHLPGQDHYRTPGPPGRRRGNSEQNKQYLKLQYLPNTNLLFIPPLAGFFLPAIVGIVGALFKARRVRGINSAPTGVCSCAGEARISQT